MTPAEEHIKKLTFVLWTVYILSSIDYKEHERRHIKSDLNNNNVGVKLYSIFANPELCEHFAHRVKESDNVMFIFFNINA